MKKAVLEIERIGISNKFRTQTLDKKLWITLGFHFPKQQFLLTFEDKDRTLVSELIYSQTTLLHKANVYLKKFNYNETIELTEGQKEDLLKNFNDYKIKQLQPIEAILQEKK